MIRVYVRVAEIKCSVAHCDKVMGSVSLLVRETALPMPPNEGAGLSDPDPLFCLDQDEQLSFRE